MIRGLGHSGRQLIQDHIKELRDLVPNSEKCSIDGLLDKTIKHMLFLRDVTNQADKLRHQVLKEETNHNTAITAEVNRVHQNGTSWAVELGNEHHQCPIIVKDLDNPGQMLIEMMCTDHGRFLEITDVIQRLQLTILKAVMEKCSEKSWAHFIVEATESGKLPTIEYLLASDATFATSRASWNQDKHLKGVLI